MAVKIRLMRIGTNRQPFYRIVAVDERKKRTGGYLELLGTYNPLTNPKEINLRKDRIDDWIKKGAVPSYGFLRIIGKAPQRAPRKAKKEKKVEPSVLSPAQSTPAAKEQAVEETQAAEVAQQATGPTIETQPAEAQETTPTENTKPSAGAAEEKEPKKQIADS